MAEELLLTPEEAFRQLKIGRAKGFQLLASGELPSIKIGRLRRIVAERLREWVEEQAAQQAKTPEPQEAVQKTPEQCINELRTAVSQYFDGVDAEEYVSSIRGKAEGM